MKEKIKKILAFVTLKNISKFFCAVIAITVIGMLGYRIFSINYYPSDAKGVIVTDVLAASYNSGTLLGKTWKLSANYDADGEFFAYQPIYFKNEQTLIVTVRYNDSVIEKLKYDGGGDTLPLFPALKADGTEKIFPLKFEYSKAFGLYSYRRYVFENISLDECKSLDLDIYLTDNYEGAPYSSITIYADTFIQKDYKFTEADKKDLS